MSGDCYEAAGRWMTTEFDTDCYLIHAEVIGQGPLEGVPYGHAFILCGDTVLDYSNGRKIEMPKFIYYALGKIEATVYFDPNKGMVERDPKIYQYTREEMTNWIMETGHWGPWELETDSGYQRKPI